MKKVFLLALTLAVTTLAFAGGKGDKKCCKKESKESAKTEAKAAETKK